MSEAEKKKQLSLEFQSVAPVNGAEPSADTSIGEILEWTCHPAKKNRKKTILVTAFIAVVVLAVYFWTYSAFFTILAILILTGSLAAYYFPTHYTFTEDEIIIRTTTQRLVKKWAQYRSYYPDKNGVLLSPFVRPSRLENFRGVFIRFSDNKDEVVGYVMRRIGSGGQTGAQETN